MSADQGAAQVAAGSPAENQAPLTEDPDLIGHLLEAWKKTIDVQQHFNQIEMDIRKTAVTVLVTVIGAAGFAADRGMQLVLGGSTINLGFLLILAGAVALVAFFFMDFLWYHKLLRGAVEHGAALEKVLVARGVPVDLTQVIGRFSPVAIGRYKIHSNGKIKGFYALILLVLTIFMVGASRGSAAPKPAPPAPMKQSIELLPNAVLKAEVRLVASDTMPPTQPTAAAVQHGPPAKTPAATPAPSQASPAQTQTGQAAPQSSE